MKFRGNLTGCLNIYRLMPGNPWNPQYIGVSLDSLQCLNFRQSDRWAMIREGEGLPPHFINRFIHRTWGRIRRANPEPPMSVFSARSTSFVLGIPPRQHLAAIRTGGLAFRACVEHRDMTNCMKYLTIVRAASPAPLGI